MIFYVFLLSFYVFRPVVLQLNYKNGADNVKINQCPTNQVILPAHVINLQKHNWRVMLVTWKHDNKVIYSFNGESGSHMNTYVRFGLQNCENEKIQMGDVSLYFSKTPPDGEYTCETTELSTEGSKNVYMKFEMVKLFQASPAIIAISVLLAVVNICEVIFFWKYFPSKKRSIIGACCCAVIGIFLILAGLSLFQTGNSWNPLEKAGLVVAVCPPLLFFLISDVLFGFGCKIEDTRFRFGCLCCCGLQVLFFLIATAGAIMCMQDCPPNLISEMLLISGLLLYTITEIGDISCCCYCYWLEHKEDRSNQMVNATPNSNNAVECEPLSTKS